MTQQFITSYKIDPKIYFPAKKVPSKNGTFRIPIYGSYPPSPPRLRFIDSLRFMSSSLDSLTTNLVRGGQELFGFEKYTLKQYELLVHKGIYPCEYMSFWDRFEETALPPPKAFYSKLNMAGVSSEDYALARSVWAEFGLHNLGEYHYLYLEMDVILLANVFEAFRGVCTQNYGLDPAHFYMAPGLAWKACLKKTRIRLLLLDYYFCSIPICY